MKRRPKFKYLAAAVATLVGTNSILLTPTFAEGAVTVDSISVTGTYGENISQNIIVNNGNSKDIRITDCTVGKNSYFTIKKDNLAYVTAGVTGVETGCSVIVNGDVKPGTYTNAITHEDLRVKVSYIVEGENKAGDLFVKTSTELTINKINPTPTVTVDRDNKIRYGKSFTPVVDVNENCTGAQTIWYSTWNSTTSKWNDWFVETPTEAGDYGVKVKIKENEYCNASAGISTFTILKTQINPTIKFNSKVYDGKRINTPFIKNAVGETTVTYINRDTKKSSTTAPRDAGTYDVIVDMTGDNNHESYHKEFKKAFTIKKANINPFIKFNDKVYDGKRINTPFIKNAVGETTVTYINRDTKKSSTTAPRDAGTYDVVIDMSGDNNHESYHKVFRKAFTIKKADINPRVWFSNDKTYDGKPIMAPFIRGAVGKTTVTYINRETGRKTHFAPTSAGTYDVVIDMKGDNNHESYHKVFRKAFTIKKASVTLDITAASASYIFDGTEKTVSGFEITNVSNALYDITKYLDSSIADGKSISAQEVGVYDFELTEEDFVNLNKNFDVTFNITSGSLTIEKAPDTIKTEVITPVSPLSPDTGFNTTVNTAAAATDSNLQTIAVAILASTTILGLYGLIRRRA